jgi:aminoglycoside phosphotransferase
MASFEQIAPKELREIIGDGVVVETRTTRLGGECAFVQGPRVGELLITFGGGQQRLELLREVRLLRSVGNFSLIPECVGFVDEGDTAFLVVKKIHALPLNEAWSAIGNETGLRILDEVFEFLSQATGELLNRLADGVSEELADIRRLLDAKAIDAEAFKKDTHGIAPEAFFDASREQFARKRNEILTHGDLCLPNILVKPDGHWVLIDWGKSGRGPVARDLASLEGSLERNAIGGAFDALLSRLGISDTPEFRSELTLFRGIDLFWYHAEL